MPKSRNTAACSACARSISASGVMPSRRARSSIGVPWVSAAHMKITSSPASLRART
nr:hypothetical protein [Nannocystis sp.]